MKVKAALISLLIIFTRIAPATFTASGSASRKHESCQACYNSGGSVSDHKNNQACLQCLKVKQSEEQQVKGDMILKLIESQSILDPRAKEMFENLSLDQKIRVSKAICSKIKAEILSKAETEADKLMETSQSAKD